MPRPAPPCLPGLQDHKPNDLHEMARIVAAGGKVARSQAGKLGPQGPYRVFLPQGLSPGLAVARAFGDMLLAKVGARGWVFGGAVLISGVGGLALPPRPGGPAMCPLREVWARPPCRSAWMPYCSLANAWTLRCPGAGGRDP